MNHAITWKKHHKTILTSAQHVPSLCGQDVAMVLMRTSELVELYGGGKRNHGCLQQAAGVSVRVSPYRFMRPKASCTGVGPPAKEICKQVKNGLGQTSQNHHTKCANTCMCVGIFMLTQIYACANLHVCSYTRFFCIPFRG